MGPKVEEKPEPPKKVKKQFTEEEKRMRAEYAVLEAEEMRKKKIRKQRDSIQKYMVDEEKLSKTTMLNIHKEWRKFMRQAAVQEMRGDIEWLSKNHIHQVEKKARDITKFQKTLDESEMQHRNCLSKHLDMLDTLLDLHYMRTKKMEEDFKTHLQNLNNSFSEERDLMTQTHTTHKKELRDVMKAMKADFEEALDDKRQDFETSCEELKNKNTEDYNVLKISLENKIEALERQIELTHSTYIANTELKSASFKQLSAKDAITSKVIEQRMRKLVKLHEQLAYLRAHTSTNCKEWEATNKALRDEKDHLSKYYQILKRSLNKLHHSEHGKLKKISKDVGMVMDDLKKQLITVERLQKLASLNKRLETEHEQIFPFNPLYVSTIPTAPTTRLDEDFAADEHCKLRKIEEAVIEDNIVALDPVPGRVVPNTKERGMINMELPIPSNLEESQLWKGPTFQWSSYAVDDNGVEVEELDYLQNFQRRYNKVLLDKLAIEMDRHKLEAENRQLQKSLGSYLDGLTMSERAKSEYNALFTVDCKLMSPRTPFVRTIIESPRRAKKKE